MNSVSAIVLILLIVIAAVAFARMLGGVARPVGPTPPRERVIEREVEPPPAERVIERDVVDRPSSPSASANRRVVEREVIREDPDVL